MNAQLSSWVVLVMFEHFGFGQENWRFNQGWRAERAFQEMDWELKGLNLLLDLKIYLELGKYKSAWWDYAETYIGSRPSQIVGFKTVIVRPQLLTDWKNTAWSSEIIRLHLEASVEVKEFWFMVCRLERWELLRVWRVERCGVSGEASHEAPRCTTILSY